MVQSSSSSQFTVAFVGFGEAASAIVSGWAGAAPAPIRAYDIKTDTAGAVRAAKLADYEAAGVSPCTSAQEAADADVVFSLVTADQAFEAARSVAPGLRAGALYLDCNSCAPDNKRRSERVIAAAGGRYVDVAVMAPIHPRLHRTPLLMSGAAAEAALGPIGMLGMDATVVSANVGDASAIKLVRSIMVKGLEALTAECVLAGRHLGVEETVLRTLEETYPGFGWSERAAHMLGRMTEHGQRRSAEMRETAAMVEALGLPARMALATAAWQLEIGELGLEAGDANYQCRADRILDKVKSEDPKTARTG